MAGADTRKPLRKDAERNRQRILAAASELFAERGLGVTLDDIAAHAGVGVGTAYRRYTNKEELIDALFERRLDQLGELAAEASDDPDAWRALTTFLEASTRLMLEDRGFMEILQNAEHGQERVAHARERVAPLITAIVERARRQGDLRPDFADTDLPLIQLALGALIDKTRKIEPMLYRRYLAIFLDGMRNHAPTTPLPIAPLSAKQAHQVFEAGARAHVPSRR